jgi:hypothetical protein
VDSTAATAAPSDLLSNVVFQTGRVAAHGVDVDDGLSADFYADHF